MNEAATETSNATADGVERILCHGRERALIIYASFHGRGIHFFTPNEFSQQLAYMHHAAGKVIDAHVHNMVPRQVLYTQEVLIIKKGKLRVDFYDDAKCYAQSRVLQAGDVILLIEGGHGFEVLEEIEMIEVKQGPYVGDQDKVRFRSALPEVLKMSPPEKA